MTYKYAYSFIYMLYHSKLHLGSTRACWNKTKDILLSIEFDDEWSPFIWCFFGIQLFCYIFIIYLFFKKIYIWAGFKAKVLGTLELCVCNLFSLQWLTFCDQACLVSVLVWNSPCTPAMPNATPGIFRLTFSLTQPFKEEERSLGVEI